MFGRSLILAAAVAVWAIWSPGAHSQSFTDPSGKTQAVTSFGDETYSGGQPGAVPPTVPGVPPALPQIYSERPPPGLPHLSAPTASPGQFATPAPRPGPVTGYGAGGMAPMPGAPANPPYSFGPFR
jgi:hypothetical protein